MHLTKKSLPSEIKHLYSQSVDDMYNQTGGLEGIKFVFVCLCGLVGYILLVGGPMPPGNAFAMWLFYLKTKHFQVYL